MSPCTFPPNSFHQYFYAWDLWFLPPKLRTPPTRISRDKQRQSRAVLGMTGSLAKASGRGSKQLLATGPVGEKKLKTFLVHAWY